MQSELELSDKKFQAAIDKLISESRKREKDYDHDTVHGVIKKSQLEWAKENCTELDSLKQYASTLKDCN